MASRIQLVHYACAGRTAGDCGSVEVACRVAGHTRPGVAAVGTSRESIEHRLLAGGTEFVHDAKVCCAALVGGPVEVTRRVAGYTRRRVHAVSRAWEAVEHRLLAGHIQFVDDAKV